MYTGCGGERVGSGQDPDSDCSWRRLLSRHHFTLSTRWAHVACCRALCFMIVSRFVLDYIIYPMLITSYFTSMSTSTIHSMLIIEYDLIIKRNACVIHYSLMYTQGSYKGHDALRINRLVLIKSATELLENSSLNSWSGELGMAEGDKSGMFALPSCLFFSWFVRRSSSLKSN